jgi:hypothetical protein
LQAEWALNNIEEVKQQRDDAKTSVASMETKLQEVRTCLLPAFFAPSIAQPL